MDTSDPGRALVTGASGGIGLALAEEFARNGHDLALVARSEDRLVEVAERLHDEYGVHATVLPRDLAEPGAARDLYETLDEEGIDVHVLVNNAGIGVYGLAHTTDLDEELTQVRLNVETVVALTRLYLDEFVARDRGGVLNVGSMAGFSPGPKMAGYYASKAHVVSYTESIAEELRGTGVATTVLCPGPVDTGFQDRADMGESLIGSTYSSTPEEVARAGYAGLADDDTIVIPSLGMRALYYCMRLTPRPIVRRVARRVNSDR